MTLATSSKVMSKSQAYPQCTAMRLLLLQDNGRMEEMIVMGQIVFEFLHLLG